MVVCAWVWTGAARRRGCTRRIMSDPGPLTVHADDRDNAVATQPSFWYRGNWVRP